MKNYHEFWMRNKGELEDFEPEFRDLPVKIPIFPLSGALLLPGGTLPLNIFEPRYLSYSRCNRKPSIDRYDTTKQRRPKLNHIINWLRRPNI